MDVFIYVLLLVLQPLDSSAHHHQNELFGNYLPRKPQIKAYRYLPTFPLLLNLKIVSGSGQGLLLRRRRRRRTPSAAIKPRTHWPDPPL